MCRRLGEAARDGVDVRLLVPGSSDVPALQPIVRAGYRSLIEAGIRVFEWNGSMLHAKTAVADGRWARVGSTNLNIASWATNWELDVVIEDADFAEAMEAMYLEDLANATEIVPGSAIPPPVRPGTCARAAGHALQDGRRAPARGRRAGALEHGRQGDGLAVADGDGGQQHRHHRLRAPGACRADHRLSGCWSCRRS